MPAYRFADAVLESAEPIPELPAADCACADVSFGVDRGANTGAVTWYQDLPDAAGRVHASFGRCGGAYLLRFHGSADFVVERRRGWAVTCVPTASVGDTTIRHLLLDQVLPVLVVGTNRVALHASAVRTPAGTAAFLGASGAGKSTLAAAFWEAGDTLVADDTLLVAPAAALPLIVPAYPSLRLWPDATAFFRGGDRACRNVVADGRDKVRLALPERDAGLCAEPIPLSAMYVVVPAPDRRPAVEPMAPLDRFRALLPHVYRLDPFDRQAIAAELDTLHRIAAIVDVRRLFVPRGFDVLETVRRAVLDDLAARDRGAT